MVFRLFVVWVSMILFVMPLIGASKEKATPVNPKKSEVSTPKKEVKEPAIVNPSKVKQADKHYMLIGKVFNTKKTLEIFNADIRVNVFPYPAHSSKDGAFKYPMKLKPGEYEISAEKKGYKPYNGVLKIAGNKERFIIEFYLAPEDSKEASRMETPSSTKIAPPPVVVKKVVKKPVKKEPLPKKVEKKPIQKEENPEKITAKMAMTLSVYGETAVSTLLSPVGRMSTGTVIAGSAGRDVGCFVDGMKLPFCFGAFSSGSIVPPEFLQSSSTLTAGYGGDLQDSAGAAVSLKLIESREGPVQGNAYFGLDKISISLNGNLSPKDYLAISFRRSMDDLFASWFYKSNVNFMFSENYDGLLNYVHKFDKMGVLKIGLIGAFSDVGFHGNTNISGMPRTRRTLDAINSFMLLHASWRYTKGGFTNELSGRFMLSDYNYNNWTGYLFRTTDNTGYIDEKISFSFKKYHTVFAKLSIRGGLFSVNTTRSLLPLNGESGMQFQDNSSFSNPGDQKYGHLTLSGGYSFDWKGLQIEPTLLMLADFHNKEYVDIWLDPRLTLSYTIKKKAKIYAGGGLYSAMPQYDINSHVWGVETLTMEHAIHGLLGFKYTGPHYSARLEGFVRSYFNVIARTPGDIGNYNNEGEAIAAGGLLEVVYRYKKKLITKFDLTVAYARRKDFASDEWRKDDGDIPVTMGLSAKYTPIKPFTFGFSYRLSSGRPYTEIVGSTYYPSFALRLPTYSTDTNEERGGYLHLLQADATYTFFLKKGFTLGLSAMVKTGFGSEVDRAYSSDYSQSFPLSAIPVVTTLGISGTF